MKETKGLLLRIFFITPLYAKRTLNHTKYNYIDKNEEIKINQKLKGEIDIVLKNGSHIALIEIKAKANINDLEKLDTYIDSYKLKYPYEKRKIFIYYGSFCFE